MGVPVATSVNAGDCLAGLAALTGHNPYRSLFETDVKNFLEATFVRSTSSGRAALFFTLLGMRRLSFRTEVIIPAFVCPSVARAVVKAGLRPVLCDVGPSGSGLATESLRRAISQQTLAVLTAHLYGYPCDITPVVELAHSVGAWVIEDAAQAFGAKASGHYVGTAADAGIFSFGMSKALWGVSGGLITTSDRYLARAIDEVVTGAPETGRLAQAIGVAMFAALSAVVRTHWLGPVATVWSACFRGRRDCEDFIPGKYPQSHAAAGRSVLSRFAAITAIRRRNAEFYQRHLSGCEGIELPIVPAGTEPVFLRYPVIVRDVAERSRLLARLRSHGVNASEMYSRSSYDAVCQFTDVRPVCPQSEYLADHILNLPTHPYVQQCDLANTVAAFRSVLGPVCNSGSIPSTVEA
jgi:dTDP-4-amino-4,6-dideoxygalactose transaminase